MVKKAKHKETGEIFAVKVISKKNVQQDLHRLAIEMEVLQTVQHPNIIELKEVFETEEMLYIVTELVTGGELFDRIVSKGSYSEHDAAALVRKFVEALDYLHDKGIVHRDLKPENLLLKNDDEDTDIKLADFGLSKIMGSEVMMQTVRFSSRAAHCSRAEADLCRLAAPPATSPLRSSRQRATAARWTCGALELSPTFFCAVSRRSTTRTFPFSSSRS